MTMRAVSNVDTILIMRDPQFNVGATRTVAVFHPEDNLMTMTDGEVGHLTEVLRALRKHQKERNMLITPVRLVYW